MNTFFLRQNQAIITFFITGLLLLGLLLCSGCWDRRELTEINLVGGVALDKAPEPDKILVTAQVIDVGQLGTMEGSGSQNPVWNMTSEGETTFDAIRNFTLEMPNQLFWAHNAVLIIGSDLAKQGIAREIDFFTRDAETRDTTLLLVAEGRGSDILKTPTHIENIPSLYTKNLVQRQGSTSQTIEIDILAFNQRILSDTTYPIAPIIRIHETGEKKNLRLLETAVFDKEIKWIGSLDKKATRGLLWVLGDVKSGIIVVKAPETNENVSLEIVQASSKVVPDIKNGKIMLTVTIMEKGNLGESPTSIDLLSSDVWNTLERRKSAVIRNEIQASLEQARNLSADVFGFGDLVQKKFPNEWEKLAPRWQEIFPEIEVNIIVNTRLCRSGKAIKTLPEK